MRPFDIHHEPPRSKGSLLLISKWGEFVIKPAVFLICKHCHIDRHDSDRLKIDWKWDSEDDAKLFLDGWFMSHGYAEHDNRFFNHGCIVIKHMGKEWEVRR